MCMVRTYRFVVFSFFGGGIEGYCTKYLRWTLNCAHTDLITVVPRSSCYFTNGENSFDLGFQGLSLYVLKGTDSRVTQSQRTWFVTYLCVGESLESRNRKKSFRTRKKSIHPSDCGVRDGGEVVVDNLSFRRCEKSHLPSPDDSWFYFRFSKLSPVRKTSTHFTIPLPFIVDLLDH